MTLCKFYLQGSVMHVVSNTAPQDLMNQNITNGDAITRLLSVDRQVPLAQQPTQTITMLLAKAGQQIIYDNLKNEHPSWPFSSFGAPFFRPLIQGDLSFEEYHLAAIEAQRNGTFPQWQQECDRRIAEIKGQEENVLRNLKQAWQYNVNEPYYPSGKLEGDNNNASGTGGAFGGGTTTAFGGAAGGSGSSTFGKPASSFGSSPFGSMPASAFSLGSRDSSSGQTSAFGASPSAFGSNNTTSAFGQQSNSAFGVPATTSAFGQGTTSAFGLGSTSGTTSAFGGGASNSSAFGAKPSAFGSTSGLPAPPTTGLSSMPTFGQTSTLGSSGLPPPPGTGFGNTPTFGQPSSLGVLGGGSTAPTFGQTSALGAMAGGTSAPAFGQASSFSSPFSSGLGKSLGGGSFGAKSTFGSFGQAAASQPSAFAQAAQSSGGFLQGGGNQTSAFGTNTAAGGGGAFGGAGNRFTVLSDVASAAAAVADKDDEMADSTPMTEKTIAFPSLGPTSATMTDQAAQQPPPPPPSPPPAEKAAPPAPPSQPAATSGLAAAFGGLSTKHGPAPASTTFGQRGPSTSTATPTTTPTQGGPLAARTLATGGRAVQDEMAAWMAPQFIIGMIPETEPPMEVR